MISCQHQTSTTFTVEKDGITAQGTTNGLMNCSSPTTSCWYHPNNVALTLSTNNTVHYGAEIPFFYLIISCFFIGTTLGICIPMGFYCHCSYRQNEEQIEKGCEDGWNWVVEKSEPIAPYCQRDFCCQKKIAGPLVCLNWIFFFLFYATISAAFATYFLYYDEPLKNRSLHFDCRIVSCNVTQTMEYRMVNETREYYLRNVSNYIVEKDGFTVEGIKENFDCNSNFSSCYYHPRNVGLTLSIYYVDPPRQIGATIAILIVLLPIAVGSLIPMCCSVGQSTFWFIHYLIHRPLEAYENIEQMLMRDEEEVELRKQLKPIFVVEQAVGLSDIDIVCQDGRLR